MASKITAFAGSPRKGGFTWALLKEVLRGAEDGGAEVKVYDLNDPGFRGCQGCFYCRSHQGCRVDDILQPFFDEVGEVSGIVFASPIYFADISGQGKMWLDRMFPMLDGQSFSPRHPGKRVVDIFTQGDGHADRFQPAIDRLHGFINGFGWKVEETLVCAGTSETGFALPPDLMGKAYAAGRKLAEK